ncbi:MAG: glycosyltransferase family 4 protein [Bacteroidales bacterium]|nr:glycosyltransferase family 4 protein [Bacteroidales bacterium]
MFFRKYDLIHVFHLDAAFIIPLLRIKYRVIAGHRARPQDSSKWSWIEKQYFNFMEYIFYKLPADMIVSNSLPMIQEYKHKTKKTIQYIPNGVVFSPCLTDFPPIEYDNYIVFSAARLMETKGCHLLLEALELIHYKGLALVLGSFEHSPRYIDYLRQLSKNLNVKYLGLIRDKKLLFSYITHAKFAVFPTYLEAMSNTLLEFALLKVPVICSNIPENTLVLNENESIHFVSRSVSNLADKIIWALENPVKLVNIAENAYHKVFTEYNWKNLAPQYEKLYFNLIKKKPTDT